MSFIGSNQPVTRGELAQILANLEQLRIAIGKPDEPIEYQTIVQHCFPDQIPIPDAVAVDCPHCGRKAGNKCIWPSGFFRHPHIKRRRAVGTA